MILSSWCEHSVCFHDSAEMLREQPKEGKGSKKWELRDRTEQSERSLLTGKIQMRVEAWTGSEHTHTHTQFNLCLLVEKSCLIWANLKSYHKTKWTQVENLQQSPKRKMFQLQVKITDEGKTKAHFGNDLTPKQWLSFYAHLCLMNELTLRQTRIGRTRFTSI